MSKINSAKKLTRSLQVVEGSVLLFGSPTDPEVAESIRKLKMAGREVHTTSEYAKQSDTIL